eukprot:Pompholyxophrys_punicea_v1_NODE_14_length_6313_cov_26.358102.p1 type:complete len:181 gc:universal NODE_14_length_6313_cov_26.358102:3747-3205(-)
MNGIVALCHFCESHGPAIVFCTQAFHNEDYKGPREENASKPTISSMTPNSNVCPACSSIPSNEKGFITHDFGSRTSYISTKNPLLQNLYSVVRTACVRWYSLNFRTKITKIHSLSCDGREGPVLFGDEKDGYVFSYVFKIQDTQARGMQRLYGFVLLMTDRIHLVSSWPFLVWYSISRKF